MYIYIYIYIIIYVYVIYIYIYIYLKCCIKHGLPADPVECSDFLDVNNNNNSNNNNYRHYMGRSLIYLSV